MPGKRASQADRRAQILRAAFAVATRERLDGLTARAVAAEAGVSSGLVFFHFGSKDGLLIALLDWLLESTALAPGPVALAAPTAEARLAEVARQEVARLAGSAPGFELFFDYWVRGTRHPEIRERIRAALERYRSAFLPFAEAAIREGPERYAGLNARDLAASVVGLIEGGALQAVFDPARVAADGYAAAIAALLGPPGDAQA